MAASVPGSHDDFPSPPGNFLGDGNFPGVGQTWQKERKKKMRKEGGKI